MIISMLLRMGLGGKGRHRLARLRRSLNPSASDLIPSSRNRVPNITPRKKYLQQFQQSTRIPSPLPPHCLKTREVGRHHNPHVFLESFVVL